MDLESLRTTLLITLSILLVVVVYRRFRSSVLRKDVPVVSHAGVLRLDVEYHPARLRIQVDMPREDIIHTRLLDMQHRNLHDWEDLSIPQGIHEIERMLPPLEDGTFHLEVRTATQRTVRGFRLRNA